MRKVRTVFLLLILLSGKAFAQKYVVPGCPVSGCFYVDTARAQKQSVSRYASRYVDIIADDKMVFASAKGRVVICYPRADKTFEVGVRYANYIVVYTNLVHKLVRKNELVDIHSPIGDLVLDPRDKHYHLGLQVVKADDPNQVLWGRQLAQFLNATPAN